MRKLLLHVLLMVGACTTIAFANPTENDFVEKSNWCYSTVKFKNTGCQTVKIYKKYGWNLYYYKTLNPGSYYNQSTYYGHQWVFKINGNYFDTYTVDKCNYHSYEIDTEGCGGNDGSDCNDIPNSLSGLIYMGEYNGSKYFCSDDNNNNWSEASANNAATQLGGHLVVINSAGENEFIRNSVMANHVWIGLTDEVVEGDFKWVNGDGITFSNWSYGEPNDQGIYNYGADHAILEKSSGKWKDRNDTDNYEFVIEVPCTNEPVCEGEISGVRFFSLGGGSHLDIADGATYQLTDLPVPFNIEALVTGNLESVQFILSGAMDDEHVENTAPYHLGGDINAMSLVPGDYSLAVKGFNGNDASGENCSEKTFKFTVIDDVCKGEITGLRFHDLGGGPGTDIADGGEYQLADLPAQFNVEAVVSGDLESVQFIWSGALTDEDIEGSAPYHYPSDLSVLTLVPGDYTLTAIGFSENDAMGENCSEVTVNFTISDEGVCNGEITGLRFHDLGGGPGTDIADGGEYQLADLPAQFNVEAVVSGDLESVQFIWSGALTDEDIEGSAPYHYPSDLSVLALVPGDYTLTAIGFSENDAMGENCSEVTVNFTISDEGVCNGEITGLRFHDLGGGPGTDIADGGEYQLADLPAQFNVEAVVSGDLESVQFIWSGALTDEDIEGSAPYHYPSDLSVLALVPGDYTLTAIGFSENDAMGENCSEVTVNFTISDEGVCNGEITGLRFHDLDGGLGLDIVNGGNYQLADLPAQFNVEAVVSGDLESVQFIWSGALNDIDVEGSAPYHYPSDLTALSLTSGDYYLTVRGYSENDAMGENCSEKSIHFTISDDQPNCENVCKRVVSAITACSGSGPYTIYLQTDNGGNYFDGGGQTWEECEDGTIHYYGTATKSQGSTDDDYVLFDLYFSDKTVTPPANSPKANACFGYDASTFVYYTQTSGTITSPNHGTIEVTRMGPAFQLGLGANHQSPDFGASGWLEFVSGGDYYTTGDINLALSPECDVCISNDFDLACEKNLSNGGWEIDDNCIVRVCEGEQVALRVNADGLPTTWIGPNGFTANTEEILISSAALTDAGSYTATVDKNGCIKTHCIKLRVKQNPDVDVEANDLTCGETDGVIKFFFDDNSSRTRIEFSIDGGNTYPLNVSDASVMASYENLAAGIYDVYVRWGNDECAVSLGQFTLNVPADSDGDGLCDDDDCVPDDPVFPATPGDPCDDNDPTTVNDVVSPDGCSCAGTYDPCALLSGDTDGDGFCDLEDCFPFDPALPAPEGTPCDDGNADTENDVIQLGGCSCAGTPITPCENVEIGGTIGFLNSCSPTIVYCTDDGDAPLIQDCISPIGGSGDLEIVWLKSTTSCLPPTTTFDDIANDPHWEVILNASGLDYAPGVLTESTCFLRCTRRENCDVFIESNIVRIEVNCDLDVDCDMLDITAKVGQIIVSGLDQAPKASVQVFSPDYSITYFTCPNTQDCNIPTQVIDLAEGDYLVYVKLYDDGFNLICERFDIYTVPPCQNVELGGYIGFDNCLGSYIYCPLTDPMLPIINNCGDPEGGVGDLEIVWLQSTSSCLPPTTTFDSIAFDPHWEVITGENSLSFTPIDVTQNTCYLRCVRREGCDVFIESNIISLTIDTDCLTFDRFGVSIGDRVWNDLNGDGVQDDDEPGIENIWINLQDGSGNSLGWTNTDENGEYIFFGLSAGTYQLQFSAIAFHEITSQDNAADDDSDSDVTPASGLTPIFTLIEGDHLRNVDCGFRLASQPLASSPDHFNFEVVKGDEHTELYWTHDAGKDVVDYAIERSTNGGRYEEITIQPSLGGTAAELYTDFDIAPATGDNHYRVKLYYIDGTVGYSDPILVHFADLIDFTVFPNPASDFVKVNLESVVGRKVDLQVINSFGIPVKIVELEQVYSKYYQIDLRDLKEGHYVLWVMPERHKAKAKQLIIGKP